MKKHIITIMAVAAVMLASCSDSDSPSANAGNAEMPEIKVEIEGIESWSESRAASPDEGEVVASCISKDDDGSEYLVEVVSKDIDDNGVTSRAGVFDDSGRGHKINVLGWMKDDSDGGNELLYVRGLIYKPRKTTEESNPQWTGLYPDPKYYLSSTGDDITGYRWPGTGFPMAFVGIYAREYMNPRAIKEDDYTNAGVEAHDIVINPNLGKDETLGVTVMNDAKYNRPIAFAAKGTPSGYGLAPNERLELRFAHVTAAVEVVLQSNFLDGLLIKNIKLTGVQCKGSYLINQSDVYPLTVYSTLSDYVKTEPIIESNGTDYVQTMTLDFKMENGVASSSLQISINPDDYLYVLPQTVKASSNFLIFFECVSDSQPNGFTKRLKLPDITFEMGKKVILRIKKPKA